MSIKCDVYILEITLAVSLKLTLNLIFHLAGYCLFTFNNEGNRKRTKEDVLECVFLLDVEQTFDYIKYVSLEAKNLKKIV